MEATLTPRARPFWPRPAEWIALAFAAYLGIRLALAPAGDSSDNLPRLDMVAAVLVAILIRQLVRYRALPWPEESELQRMHWLLFPFALAPLVLELLDLAGQKQLGTDGGRLWEAPLAAIWTFRRLALAGAPLLLAWLGLGTHIKSHGRLQAGALLGEASRGIVGALRDWAPPVVLVFLYGKLGGLLEHGPIPDQDALLFRLDRALFLGHDPHAALEAIQRPWLSTWMAFCYVWYAPLYPLCFAILYVRSAGRRFEELATAVTLTLAVGFATYALVPALGPMFTRPFGVDLHDFYLSWALEQLMDKYRVPRDCFPSLHTAVSLVFLFGLWRGARRAFWLQLPVVATIPLACVYLRYHYVVDVLAGVVLAVVADRVARAWVARTAPAGALHG